MAQVTERPVTRERVEAPRRRNGNTVGMVLAVLVLGAVSAGVILLNGTGGTQTQAYIGVPVGEQAAIAGYASTEGLTGLSPASLQPVENVIRAGVNPTTSAQQLAMLATYAAQRGMTGLSPASLAPVTPSLEAWARSEGLKGLSPASLTEVVPSLEAWAQGEGLMGLSPASLSRAPMSDMAAIARWAELEGLTGLSPASLQPIER